MENGDSESSAPPVLSVILVSDYAGGLEESWADFRKTLTALRDQDCTEEFEVILAETQRFAPRIPADLSEILPSLQIVLDKSDTSCGLKNAAVNAAAADWVAILDADCVPAPDWCQKILDAIDRYPEASAISGRTPYEGKSFLERILGLVTRSYSETSRPGPTKHISANNAVWRRSAWIDHPLPVGIGPFCVRIQEESVARDGGLCYFESEIVAVHRFEGWEMELDVRRNLGYGTVITRLRDPRLPYAWLTHLDRASIPFFVAGKIVDGLRDCVRCWRFYELRWFELPVAMALSVYVHLLEAPGMWAGFSRRRLTNTAYR